MTFWNIRAEDDDLDNDNDFYGDFSIFIRTYSASIRSSSSIILEILREFDNSESKIDYIMAVEYQFENMRWQRSKRRLRRDKKTKAGKRRNIRSYYDNNTDSDISQSELISHKIDDRSLEVIESERGIKILVEMPLVDKKDIKVNAFDRHIEILITNSQAGRYQRNIGIPSTVDIRSGKSTYRNGILEIIFDKKRKRFDRDKAVRYN
jgi:HSP20 family protein